MSKDRSAAYPYLRNENENNGLAVSTPEAFDENWCKVQMKLM